MTQLKLRILGGFLLVGKDGQEVPVPGKKAQALLAYLAMNPGQKHSREKLATLLWGDRMDEQARHSLRQALLALRKALGTAVTGEKTDPLATDNETATLNTGALETDVERFRNHAAGGKPHNLEAAVALYAGPLLEGLRTDAEGFDGWLAGERERLFALAARAMEGLAEHQEQSGQDEAAIDTAKRLLTLDPAREEGHRLLMRLYAVTGRRADALRQFKACGDALRRELDVEPSPETVQLYDALREGSASSVNDNTPAPTSTGRGSRSHSESPNRPSIAVLPFTNMSGDPDQEHFINGLTADLITDLSRIPQISVKARNTTFSDQGDFTDLYQAGKEMEVDYVLVGSIQKSGGRVRINTHLHDVKSGHEIWAERFDRTMEDLFKVQDEINQKIISALDIIIIEGEQGRIWRKSTQSPEAYDLFLRARFIWQGTLTYRGFLQAKQYMERALEIDPAFTRALTTMAAMHIYAGAWGWSPSLKNSVKTALGLAERAINIDKNLAYSYTVRALCHLYKNDHQKALDEGERALLANPTGGLELVFLGNIQMFAGTPRLAIETILEGFRQTPAYPPWYQCFLGHAKFGIGKFHEAISLLLESLEITLIRF